MLSEKQKLDILSKINELDILNYYNDNKKVSDVM